MLSLTSGNKHSQSIPHWGVSASVGVRQSLWAHLYRLNCMFAQMQVRESCCLLNIYINSFPELPLWYHRSSKYFLRTKKSFSLSPSLSCKAHLERSTTSSNYSVRECFPPLPLSHISLSYIKQMLWIKTNYQQSMNKTTTLYLLLEVAEMVINTCLYIGETRVWWMDNLVDKELAGRLHSNSCSQQLKV